MYSIKNREDLGKNQVEEVQLQDKLGNQIFQEKMKKIFEPVTDRIKFTSEKLTKTLTDSSIKNNRVLENLIKKNFRTND